MISKANSIPATACTLCFFVAVAGATSAAFSDDPPAGVAATFDPDGISDNGAAVKLAEGPYDLPPDEPFPYDDEGADPRGGGIPSNDTCANATVIPPTAVTYNAPLVNTTGATVGTCDGLESCEVGNVGVSNSVWYTYTPAASGTVTINTFGSNYNTVLSVFTGSCGHLVPPSGCADVPTQIVCNDDYPFGTTSQVTLDVTAGQNYRIKVADYNTADGGGVLDFNLFWAPANDNCSEATIIPTPSYDPTPYSTVNATTDVCENQESCEVNNLGVSNSVWYIYTPACDGFLNINTNGSNYDTVLSVWDRCGALSGIDLPCNYPDPASIEIACDDDSGTGTQSQLTDIPVTGSSTYLIKVADYNTASGGGNLNFNFMFTAAHEPVAAITSPAAVSCVCGTVNIQGTASTGGAPLAWTLDYQMVGGSGWSPISNGTVQITNGLIGSWDTSSLAQGEYILRLSVQNDCGLSTTAITVVWVDAAFDSFTIDAPRDADLVAGTTCVEGTIWDRCFDRYTVMYRASGGGGFTPVDAAHPEYTVTVITNPLAGAGWDTTGLPDGNYDVRVAAEDTCGHTSTITRTVIVDNTPPTALITSPLACTSVDGILQITGTANDAHLGGWTLQVTDGSDSGWVTIDSDSTPVIDGVLGLWNTDSLPACAYALRLLVTDDTPQGCGPLHNQAEYTVSINIGSAPGGSCCDINHDGLSNGDDVAPFVNCLLFSPCP